MCRKLSVDSFDYTFEEYLMNGLFTECSQRSLNKKCPRRVDRRFEDSFLPIPFLLEGQYPTQFFFLPRHAKDVINPQGEKVATGALNKLIDMVKSAKHSVHFEIFFFTHWDLADAMLAKIDANPNFSLQGVFNNKGGKRSVQGRLCDKVDFDLPAQERKIDFYIVDLAGKLHSKLMVKDGLCALDDSERPPNLDCTGVTPEVCTGSANWSVRAMTNNQEFIFCTQHPEIVAFHEREFMRVKKGMMYHEESCDRSID